MSRWLYCFPRGYAGAAIDADRSLTFNGRSANNPLLVAIVVDCAVLARGVVPTTSPTFQRQRTVFSSFVSLRFNLGRLIRSPRLKLDWQKRMMFPGR
jgi:hypothetical protein